MKQRSLGRGLAAGLAVVVAVLGIAALASAQPSALDEEKAREADERRSAWRARAEAARRDAHEREARDRAEDARREALRREEAEHHRRLSDERRRQEAVERERREALQRHRIETARRLSAPDGPPPPHDGPRPIVLRFQHIPAESFLRTLKQLGEHKAVGEHLREVPIALNEDANAVVVIAPPDVAEHLTGLARGLDQPNVFREGLRQREARDRAERARPQVGWRGPPRGPGAAPPMRTWQPPCEGRPWARGWQQRREGGPGTRGWGPPPEGQRPPWCPMARPQWPGRSPMHTWQQRREGRPWARGWQQRREGGPGMRGWGRRGEGDRPPWCPLARPEKPAEPPRPPADMRRRYEDRPARADAWPARPGPRPDMPPTRPGARPEAPPPPAPWGEGPGAGIGRLRMLTTPKAVEELGLSDEQVQAIRRLADEAADELREEMQELRQKAEKRRAEGKAADVSELYRDFAEERREVAEEAMEGLKKVLTPEQRERARRWLDRTGPPGGPPPGPPPARPEPGPRPQTRPGPAPRYRGAEGARPETPAVPAVQEHPARFLLIEDAPAPEGGEQPRGERPRGARGPRPGGPPFGRGFGGTTEIGPEGQGILRLLRDEAVRGDLALTPDQQTMIEDLRKDAEKATERLRSSRPAPEPGATPAPEEGRRPARGNFGAMSEAFQKFRTEMAELDKIAWQALTETQRTKAREITRARATQERAARSPLGVLLGEEAVKDLGLTPEQVERIRAVLAETSDEQGRAWREQMEKMRDVPADQRRARFEEFARQREATRAERDAALKERVLVILTPAQQEKADKYFKEAEASRGRSIGRTVRRPGGGAPPPPPPPPPGAPGIEG